jgi:hypothetical protein
VPFPYLKTAIARSIVSPIASTVETAATHTNEVRLRGLKNRSPASGAGLFLSGGWAIGCRPKLTVTMVYSKSKNSGILFL